MPFFFVFHNFFFFLNADNVYNLQMKRKQTVSNVDQTFENKTSSFLSIYIWIDFIYQN